MLVDTKVLVDVLENDPTWADWSIAQLRAQAQIHRLVINPVICAELSLTFSTGDATKKKPVTLLSLVLAWSTPFSWPCLMLLNAFVRFFPSSSLAWFVTGKSSRSAALQVRAF